MMVQGGVVMRHPWALLLLAFLLATNSAHAEAEAELARGAELLAPFKRELKATLTESLAVGPTEAIAACRLKAPEIANSHSRGDVRVGRTSHRLRNPANAAPEWVAPILAEYIAEASARSPRAVSLANDRTGYSEPIIVEAPCLTCHGETLEPAVAAQIAELYPDDSAVGFRLDDLRGAFWVEFATPK
jgi:hypothetical protein